ncbi:MAG: ABC transporter permease [Elusimicrobiota bacterium]|jgi:lipoprotein-releasing system permease protein|nr:ABC transporter permease [Elusimicrobiota bacterium]
MFEKSVELFIAFRYLKSGKKTFFSLLTNLIAIGGTTLGVTALIITLAVMSGFQTDIRDKILGIQPQIVITKADGYYIDDIKKIEDKVRENKSIIGISPFIYRQGIIRNIESGATTGVLIKAVDFKKEDEMLGIRKTIEESDIDFKGELGARDIVIGNELAKHILAYAGSEVLLTFPANFASVPKMYKFKVAAVIHSGMYDYDSSLGFMDIKAAQELFAMGASISGISAQTESFDKAVSVAAQIQEDLGHTYLSRAWIELNKNLFSALKLEKIMMFLILGLIILVAAFNIISNLLLLSAQKSKEIGIMSAIGFSKFSIAKIFFYEGLIVGFAGSVLGIIFGVSISLILKYSNLIKLPQGVYYIERLPVAIIPSDIFMVGLCAFVITIMAGIYPAYQVSKFDPLKAMREE